ncbi:cell division protein SepF [Candidatus Micrarchaeota archaeon]|nr:cell division protein SepF [Candidatus Micrarchaeota archaeon]
MGILSKLTQSLGISSDMNVDEFMSAAEAEDVDVMHQSAKFYVKPIALQSDGDVAIVQEELAHENLVLLNISPMARNPTRLKAVVQQLKEFTLKQNGDMARIDEDKILLTPAEVKIVKRRR